MNKILSLLHIHKIMPADPQIKPRNTLQIHLDNRVPMELIDLTKSLIALSSQFDAYTVSTGNFSTDSDTKLYVKQVKSGSIIIELVEFASASMLPIVANIDLVISFANHLKSIYDYLKTGLGEKPKLTVQECKELIEIVNPTAKDRKSSVSFNIINNGDNNITPVFLVDSLSANLVQNILKGEIENLNKKLDGNDIHTSELMTLYQVRGVDNKFGNKANIDSLNDKPLNVVFNSDEIKAAILNSDFNPLKTGYSVDVVIQTVNGQPTAYKIMKLHDAFELEQR